MAEVQSAAIKGSAERIFRQHGGNALAFAESRLEAAATANAPGEMTTWRAIIYELRRLQAQRRC